MAGRKGGAAGAGAGVGVAADEVRAAGAGDDVGLREHGGLGGRRHPQERGALHREQPFVACAAVEVAAQLC